MLWSQLRGVKNKVDIRWRAHWMHAAILMAPERLQFSSYAAAVARVQRRWPMHESLQGLCDASGPTLFFDADIVRIVLLFVDKNASGGLLQWISKNKNVFVCYIGGPKVVCEIFQFNCWAIEYVDSLFPKNALVVF